MEQIIAHKKYERLSFLTLFLIKTSLSTLIKIFWLTLINTITEDAIADLSYLEKITGYILDGTFRYDLIIALLLAIIISSIMQIGKLHSKGVLLKYITGRYHHPIETKRIFSFFDIKSSTTLAEELGHLKYSALCRDFFYDITEGILLSKGEVYQYLGDGLIISRPWQKCLDKANCVQSFFHV
ncbi:MAG: adenylate cyclase [Saprospiraceae bacterium]|jgi:adenylate cyclase